MVAVNLRAAISVKVVERCNRSMTARYLDILSGSAGLLAANLSLYFLIESFQRRSRLGDGGTSNSSMRIVNTNDENKVFLDDSGRFILHDDARYGGFVGLRRQEGHRPGEAYRFHRE